ncbi:MAG: alpha/beta hydrolase [Litorilinea sp.]
MADRQHEWQDADVATNGIRVHYWRTGGDKPPLVLLHGITDNGLCWRRVAAVLADDYDLIMVDGRGHGESDKPDRYRLDDYAADTAGLIEALALGKPGVMGHSLGAAIGATLTASRPDLVRCLALEDPPWRQPASPATEEARREHMQTWRAETVERKATMSHAEIVAAGKARSTTWHADEFDPWAQAKLDVSEHVFDNVGAGLAEWRTFASQIKCPTLLVGGDSELGAIVTPDIAQEAATLNPRITFTLLADAGHNVRREQFDAFLAAVQPFLAQHMS